MGTILIPHRRCIINPVFGVGRCVQKHTSDEVSRFIMGIRIRLILALSRGAACRVLIKREGLGAASATQGGCQQHPVTQARGSLDLGLRVETNSTHK